MEQFTAHAATSVLLMQVSGARCTFHYMCLWYTQRPQAGMSSTFREVSLQVCMHAGLLRM